MFIPWGSLKYCFQLAWHRLTTWLLCWLCQSLLWSFHKDKDQGEWIVKEIIYNLTGFLFKRRPSRARRCWGIEAGVQKRQLPCFTIFTFLSWCLVHLIGQHIAEISVFKMVQISPLSIWCSAINAPAVDEHVHIYGLCVANATLCRSVIVNNGLPLDLSFVRPGF